MSPAVGSRPQRLPAAWFCRQQKKRGAVNRRTGRASRAARCNRPFRDGHHIGHAAAVLCSQREKSPANTKGRLVMTAMITFALGDASVTAHETRALDARWRLRDPRTEFFVVSVPPEPPTCTHCGTRMQEVATVAPFADQPGLRAYQCSKCGHTSSVLEAPDKFRARSRAR